MGLFFPGDTIQHGEIIVAEWLGEDKSLWIEGQELDVFDAGSIYMDHTTYARVPSLRLVVA